MTSTFAQDLIASLGEALDHAGGARTAAREHVLNHRTCAPCANS